MTRVLFFLLLLLLLRIVFDAYFMEILSDFKIKVISLYANQTVKQMLNPFGSKLFLANKHLFFG